MTSDDPSTETWREAIGIRAGDGGLWCQWCPTHVDTPAELALHMVGAHGSTAPPYEKSTSARLRETQAALAASQADLTRVERERDEEVKALRILADQYLKLLAEVGKTAEIYLSQRDEALHDLAHAKFALSMAKARRGEQ